MADLMTAYNNAPDKATFLRLHENFARNNPSLNGGQQLAINESANAYGLPAGGGEQAYNAAVNNLTGQLPGMQGYNPPTANLGQAGGQVETAVQPEVTPLPVAEEVAATPTVSIQPVGGATPIPNTPTPGVNTGGGFGSQPAGGVTPSDAVVVPEQDPVFGGNVSVEQPVATDPITGDPAYDNAVDNVFTPNPQKRDLKLWNSFQQAIAQGRKKEFLQNHPGFADNYRALK